MKKIIIMTLLGLSLTSGLAVAKGADFEKRNANFVKRVQKQMIKAANRDDSVKFTRVRIESNGRYSGGKFRDATPIEIEHFGPFAGAQYTVDCHGPDGAIISSTQTDNLTATTAACKAKGGTHVEWCQP